MAGNNNQKRPAEYYMSLEYPITIIPQEAGEYIVEILDIPGCRFEGENLQELVKRIEKYKLDWIKLSYKRGETIPVPSNENIKHLEDKVSRLSNDLHRLKKRSIKNKIKLFWTFEQLLVLSLGVFLGILIKLTNNQLIPHFLSSWQFAAITISGAFGGLLSSLNSKELKLPKINRQGIINFGLLGDVLIGIGGAYTIFLLLPFNIGNGNYDAPKDASSFVNDIKFIAVGIIGGFSGNLITTRAADRVIQQLKRNDEDLQEKNKQLEQRDKELDEVIRQKTQEAEDLLERLRNDVRGVKEQSNKDADALSLVIRHLDKHHGLNSDEIELMKEKIKDSSPSQKVQMFYHAKKTREENWQNNKEYMERTIPVFQGLIDSDSGKRFHRNYAQLGYALKDKLCPDYGSAIEHLNTAIAIRDNIRSQAGFGRYEINRAICRIMLDDNFKKSVKSDTKTRELIYDDLIAGCRDVRAAEQIPYNSTEPITSWLNVNEISLENFSSSIIARYNWSGVHN